MTVFIVIYRGTIYGVFDSRDKAYAFATRKFGINAMMTLDVSLIEEEVQ